MKQRNNVVVNVNHNDFNIEPVIECLDNVSIKGNKVLLMDNVTFNKYVADIPSDDDTDDYKLVRDMIIFLVSSQTNYLIYKLRQEGYTYEDIGKKVGIKNAHQVWKRFNTTMNNKKINELVDKFVETNNIIAELKCGGDE